MLRIKICGVTHPEDCVAAVNAGADAIGLNFFAGSRRFLRDADRDQIGPAANSIQRVGVFVNAELAGILDKIRIWRLDAVQLHGDEPPEFQRDLQQELAGHSVRLMRAYRWGGDTISDVIGHWERCQRFDSLPDAVLIDAATDGLFGGGGRIVDWSSLRGGKTIFSARPLVLAGGLNSKNVAMAIAAVRPDGVDVASGVEADGDAGQRPRKSQEKVARFCQAANDALNKLRE